ncbi:MAG: sigma 54-interacting transcriptional regulator [Acidiferrobacterales bacterium]
MCRNRRKPVRNAIFGHERGAFTGCIGRKQGLINPARGGTLFPDGIEEFSAVMQSKLLRVLAAGEFRRVVDARLCAPKSGLPL